MVRIRIEVLCLLVTHMCIASLIDHSHKSLTSIPTSIPTDCTTLNLSYNKLTILPGKSLDYLTELVEIDLSHNVISEIQDDFIQPHTKLSSIICENCFDCTCVQAGLWRWLDLLLTTIISFRLTCIDGRKLTDITRNSCAAAFTLNLEGNGISTEGITVVICEIIVGVGASALAIILFIRMMKRSFIEVSERNVTKQTNACSIEDVTQELERNLEDHPKDVTSNRHNFEEKVYIEDLSDKIKKTRNETNAVNKVCSIEDFPKYAERNLQVHPKDVTSKQRRLKDKVYMKSLANKIKQSRNLEMSTPGKEEKFAVKRDKETKESAMMVRLDLV